MRNVVVSWLASAEQAYMAVQVIISFYRTHDIVIYDRAKVAVPFQVNVTLPRGKKTTLWALVTTISVIVGLKPSRAHASVGWPF